MNPLPSKATLVTSSKQTQETDNIAKGRSPVQPNFHPPIFPLSQFPQIMPDYRKHLKVFGEEFLEEATKFDKSLTPIIKFIKNKDWESIKRQIVTSIHYERS